MKGHMAEGARGVSGRGERVRWGARLRTQAAAHSRNLLRWRPRLSHDQGSSLLWYLWINADGNGDGMGDCVRGDQ
jgi:hypothetical protein